MEVEYDSHQSAKSLLLSEAFVFVECLAPFKTQNNTYTVCNVLVYPKFKCWMSKGIVTVTVSSVQYVYICYR